MPRCQLARVSAAESARASLHSQDARSRSSCSEAMSDRTTRRPRKAVGVVHKLLSPDARAPPPGRRGVVAARSACDGMPLRRLRSGRAGRLDWLKSGGADPVAKQARTLAASRCFARRSVNAATPSNGSSQSLRSCRRHPAGAGTFACGVVVLRFGVMPASLSRRFAPRMTAPRTEIATDSVRTDSTTHARNSILRQAVGSPVLSNTASPRSLGPSTAPYALSTALSILSFTSSAASCALSTASSM